MSEDRNRKSAGLLQAKTPIERDMERTITDLILGKETGEPIRTGKKIIRTADSETIITYELVVNNRTGQQEVVEHITSNKKECPLCRSHVTSLYNCDLCGKAVCGRHYGSLDVVDGYKHVEYEDWNDKDFMGYAKWHSREEPIYKHVNLCSNCYFERTGKRWEKD